MGKEQVGYFHGVGLSLVVFTMVHGKIIEPRYLGPVLLQGSHALPGPLKWPRLVWRSLLNSAKLVGPWASFDGDFFSNILKNYSLSLSLSLYIYIYIYIYYMVLKLNGILYLYELTLLIFSQKKKNSFNFFIVLEFFRLVYFQVFLDLFENRFVLAYFIFSIL